MTTTRRVSQPPDGRRPAPLARLHFDLGRALAWWGWKEGAVAAFQDALKADPALRDAHFRLGEALARRGQWLEASDAFAEACAAQPRSVEAWGHLTFSLARAGRFREAAASLRRLADLRPRQAEVHLLLGALLRRAGETTSAIREFRWAVRLEAQAAGHRFLLGEAVLGPKAWGDLEYAFRRARGLPAATRAARWLRGSALNAHPGAPLRPAGAAPPASWLVRFRARAVRARPRRSGPAVLLLLMLAGVAHAESRGAVAEARACVSTPREAGIARCRTAVRLGLSPARASMVEGALADKLAVLERWDEVVAVYREAVRQRPEDGLAQLRLGLAVFHTGGPRPEAEAALGAAVRLRPDDPEAWAGLGALLAVEERAEEAVAAFDEARRRDPAFLDHRPALRALAEAARAGRPWPPKG